MSEIERKINDERLKIITGPNGKGKTRFLEQLMNKESSSEIAFIPSNFLFDDFSKTIENKNGNYESISLTKFVPKDNFGDFVKFLEPVFSSFIKSIKLYKNISRNHNFSQEFKNDNRSQYNFCQEGLSGFVEEMNKVLNAIDFKYRFFIKQNENSEFDPKIVFKFGNDEKDLHEIKLSSGEKWFLGISIWKYNIETKESNPIKKLLLDEPDRNMDPQLCRQFFKIITDIFVKSGIDVIMTTHRIDTVSLAPEQSIYTVIVTGDGEYDLKKIHKLDAIFCLTRNLREITNYHFKVYTESLDDANFYEGVYSCLRKYCSSIRVERQKSKYDDGKSDYYWYLNNKPYRILSERCQLSFYAVSTVENDKGGCEEVKKAVQRDTNFSKSNKKLFNDQKLQKSYGILDNDYNKDHKLDVKCPNEDRLRDRVIVLQKRHSLENYIYDPFVLINAIDTSDLKNEIKHLFENLREAIDSNNLESIQKIIDEYFKHLIESGYTKEQYIKM